MQSWGGYSARLRPRSFTTIWRRAGCVALLLRMTLGTLIYRKMSTQILGRICGPSRPQAISPRISAGFRQASDQAYFLHFICGLFFIQSLFFLLLLHLSIFFSIIAYPLSFYFGKEYKLVSMMKRSNSHSKSQSNPFKKCIPSLEQSAHLLSPPPIRITPLIQNPSLIRSFPFYVDSSDDFQIILHFHMMYNAGYNPGMNGQATMVQMNAMMGGMGMGMGMMMNPNVFMFSGNSLSLQSRLDSLTDAECQRFIDANITVTGVEVQAMNMMSLLCTMIWGSIIILPLFFMCCDWWKRCTYAAYTISPSVYMSLGKLFRAPNLKNITVTVVDNNFDQGKARILYNLLAESRVRGFTFINGAGNYNFLSNEYSNFVSNMRPIKTLSNVTSDMRWYTEIVNY